MDGEFEEVMYFPIEQQVIGLFKKSSPLRIFLISLKIT